MTTQEETQDNILICCECEQNINSDTDDFFHSDVMHAPLCLSCYESEDQSLSVIHLIANGETRKIYVGDHIRIDEYGDPIDYKFPRLVIERKWISTDPHRGFYETTIADKRDEDQLSYWMKIHSGWTTGNWGDPISDGKQSFNEWAEQVIKGEIVYPFSIAIVAEPTSNLFSTAIGVFTPHINDWLQYVDEYEIDLSDVLK